MRRSGYWVGLAILAGLVASAGRTLTAVTDPHAYFNALVARSDHWRSYSLRDQAELLLYKNARSLPPSVTYDPGNDTYSLRQDAAKVVIPAGTNSLPNQVWLPMGTQDGRSYLTTWDAWYGPEILRQFSGLTNWKTYQFRNVTSSPRLWFEVRTRFDLAPSSSDLAMVDARSYSVFGPSVTRDQPLSPAAGAFVAKPQTWTRYWMLLEQRARDWDLVSLWVADESQNPVRLIDRLPFEVDSADGLNSTIHSFQLEFNTSLDTIAPNRGSLVSYVRNVVMLRDVVNPTAILQRPLAGVPPPPLPGVPPPGVVAPPAPPQNLRIVP